MGKAEMDKGMRRWFLVLCWTLGLASAPALALGDDQAALQAQAKKYWRAEVKKDWKAVHALLAPDEQKAVKPEDYANYRNSKTGTFQYVSAEAGETALEGDAGWVRVTGEGVLVGFPGIQPRHLQYWQLWRKHESGWLLMSKAESQGVRQLPPNARSMAEEDALKQRADAFWKAKEAQDWRAIYGYLVPEFRAKTPLQKFLDNRSMYLYVSHRLEWVEVIEGQGRVKVAYTRKLNDPSVSKMSPEEQTALEEWVKVNGQWYRQVKSKQGGEG
jgi:hypothetical protein